MYWSLMLICCITFAVNPVCLAAKVEVSGLAEQQLSGVGHGNLKDYDLYQPEVENLRKREVSVLSRGIPFSSARGLRRMRSRSLMPSEMMPRDVPSADSRNNDERPRGQPLRYGR